MTSYGDGLINARNSLPEKCLSYNVPNGLEAFARPAKESRMARIKPTSEPSASVRAQWRRAASPLTGEHRYPHQAAEANRSSVRIDELDAQNDWQARIAAGLIAVR
jgi:hypothetical protein